MKETYLKRYSRPMRSLFVAMVCTVLIAPVVSEAAGPASGGERKSPHEIATDIARHSRKAMQGFLPPAEQQGAKRDGVFLLLSFSLPEETLKEYLREAKLLGAQVVLRGLVNGSFKETQLRIKRLFLIDDKHVDETTTVGIGIDPVLYRRGQVTEVPALMIVQGDHHLIATGGSSVESMLKSLTDRNASLAAWLPWFERRHGGFHAGGPTKAPRPAMPTIASTVRVSTGYEGWGIAERDMIEFLQERASQVNWTSVRNQQNERVKSKLAKGPGLALPDATEPRRFSVDLTVQYPDDITDPTSNTLLIKAGSRVNPLEKLQWRYTMLVLNGEREGHVNWAREYLAQHDGMWIKILISAGNVEKLEKQLKHRVYWADQFVLDRFGVVAVPTLVRQMGTHLAVEEYVSQ